MLHVMNPQLLVFSNPTDPAVHWTTALCVCARLYICVLAREKDGS